MTTETEYSLKVDGADGLRLVGDTWGQKPWDAVLLHGGGQTRQAWGRTPERLRQLGLSVLNVDLRGHGESPWDPEGRYSFRDHARDLVANLAEGHPTILIGASLGGVTSLGAGLLAPERIRAIVLVDIAPTMQRTGVARIVGFMQANPDGFESLTDAHKAVAAYLPHRQGRTVDSLKRNLRHSNRTGRWTWHWDPRTLDFAHEAWYQRQTEDMTAAVRALDVPIILVRGEFSDVILAEDVERFLALGPHTRHVEVPEARHMVAGDENDTFLNQIVSELNSSVPGFPCPGG
ncbi:alpha/beta hydrolase [Dactylosporangium sp. NPDC005572]|uniref:alpha/beta fold hydrolase n=1 Tax=Dactylosporangium sp. NPDC005572 TaxID=3156889 RepID=UPI0033BDA7E0